MKFQYVFVALLITLTTVPGVCGDFAFPNFPGGVIMDDHFASQNLPGPQNMDGSVQLSHSTSRQGGSALWYSSAVLVRGFCSQFTFSISAKTTGMAFVILTTTNIHQVPIPNNADGLGYGTTNTPNALPGLTNSVAVEFDTFKNDATTTDDLHDPNDNHVSIHTLKSGPNTADESKTIVKKNTADSSMPVLVNTNGGPVTKHNVTVCYTPVQSTTDLDTGLVVKWNDLSGPVLRLGYPAFNLSALLADVPQSNGHAFIGFTCSFADVPVEHVIYDWRYRFLGNVKDQPGNILISGAGSVGAEAGAGAYYSFQLIDQFGNQYLEEVPAKEIYLSLNDDSDHTKIKLFTPLSPPPGDGKYTVFYNATTAGMATIVTKLFGNQIGTGPLNVPVTSGPAFADNSYATGPGFSGAPGYLEAGKRITFMIQGVDSWMNHCTQSTDVLNVNVTGTVAHDGSSFVSHPTVVPSSTAGIYNCTFTLKLAGSYTIQIYMNGKTTSPINVNSALVTQFEIHNSIPVAGTSTAIIPSGKLIAGVSNSLTINLNDQFGNPILVNAPKVPNFDLYFNGQQGKTSGNKCDWNPVAHKGDMHMNPGEYMFTFSCDIADPSLKFDIKFGGNSIKDSPFTLDLLPSGLTNPSACLAYGPGLDGFVVASNEIPFHVQPVDIFGNNITYQLPPKVHSLTVKNGMNSFPVKNYTIGRIDPGASGEVQFTYDATLSQTLNLHFFWDGEPIQNPTRTIKIVPGRPSASHSKIVGSGLVGALDGELGWAQVLAMDKFDNALTKSAPNDRFQVSLIPTAGPKVTGPPSANLTDNHNGTLTITYIASETGDYYLNVTLNHLPVADSPYKIVIEWAGFSNSAVLIAGAVIVLLLVLAVVGFFAVRYHRRKQYFNL